MNEKLCIVGLGYVGLPLAVEFSKKYFTIGYDINNERIKELGKYIDSTKEVNSSDLKKNIITKLKQQKKGLYLTHDLNQISECNYYIITVPTPIDKFKKPDLNPLISSTKVISGYLKKGDIVIYESTVYPGATEEVCVPILEKNSGLKFNKDFYVGYSPERINPGDKEHTITKIKKVTSGSSTFSANKIDKLYSSIISAGTYMASSIKVAEAAKVIENTQRDVNIAFINELAMIFNRLEIDTNEVLKAAGTKWNFLNFKPGLVGGHCIGVDPYYLAQKAKEIGHHPEIILAGRKVNDNMGNYVADEVIKKIIKKSNKVIGSKVLILGFTFKENCPDYRNTKVIDVYRKLVDFGANVEVFDPILKIDNVDKEFGITINQILPKMKFDAIIHAVAHRDFEKLNLENLLEKNGFIYDVKGIIDLKNTYRL